MDVERFVELARVATHGPDVGLRIVGGDIDNVRASVQRRDRQIEGFECPLSVRFDVTIEVIAPTQELGIAHFWDSEIDGSDSFVPTCNFAELVTDDMLLALGCREFDHEAERMPPNLRVPARWHQATTAAECYRVWPGFNGFATTLGPLNAGETLTLPFSAAFCLRGPETDHLQARHAAEALLKLPYPDEALP